MFKSSTGHIRVIRRSFSAFNRESTVQNISYQQATSTLRPFFFAVHPDFFGQQPEYRKQNEQSLQILNSHLNSFACSREENRNSHLVFFVRKTALSASSATNLKDNEPSIKPVQISLQHANLRELVLHILQSSKLPITDLLTHINQNASKTKSNVSFSSGNENEAYARKSYEQTLASWLLDNLPRAIELYFASQPIRANVFALEKSLLSKYKLLEIIWHSEWTPSSHLTCLRALQNILQQERAQQFLASVVGKRIIFAQQSGSSVFNDILLSVSDVPEAWLSAVSEHHEESSINYMPRGYSLSSLENGVSVLLYGAQVIQHPVIHKATPRRNYYRQVKKLLQALLRYTKQECPQFPKNLFSGMRICIEDVGGSLMYSEDFDIFLIPAGTPGFLIINFLLRYTIGEDKSNKYFIEMDLRYKSLCAELVKNWNLVGIKRDMNVSLQQGFHCLESLTQHQTSVLPRINALSGLEVCIARYFAVSSSGVIYIRWDAATI